MRIEAKHRPALGRVDVTVSADDGTELACGSLRLDELRKQATGLALAGLVPVVVELPEHPTFSVHYCECQA